MCYQVISQFAVISSGTGGETGYPEPAATFVRVLSVTNLDVVGFVPLGCIFRSSYYHTALFKSSFPPLAIALLGCYPLSNALRGRSSDAAWRTVKGLVMLLLEISLPSVTTSLVKVLLCDQYDHGWFLREQLSLPCNDSERRIGWKLFAALGLVAYPVGGARPSL